MNRAFLWAALLSLLLLACSDDGETGTDEESFVGADGVTANISDASRIVTLSGDLTEIIFELGLGESIVGVDITTVFPEEATALPVVGVGRFLAAEPVLAQDPTLVIGDTQTDPVTAIDQIRAAGVPVVILETAVSFDQLYEKIDQLGEVLGVSDAAASLIDRLRSDIEATAALAADKQPLRMAYVYTRGPDVVLLFGGEMVSNPLIEAAAGIDVGAEAGIEETVPVTAEALVAANPEVIIVPEEGYGILGGLDAFLEIPGVAQTPAGENRRIYAYPEGDFLTFGPRVSESLRLLIADVHGIP